MPSSATPDPRDVAGVPPPHPAPRRGAGRYVVLLALVVLAAAAWSGLWLYAARTTEDAIAGWRAREAAAGRIHACADQTLGGFPFRIEISCTAADSRFQNLTPPLQLTVDGVHVAAQIYQPTLLIAEFSGPLTASETGRPASLSIAWQLAQMSLRGTPAAPERVSLALDQPVVNDLAGGTASLVSRADRMELHGRIAEGSAFDNPVIETVLRLSGASFPGWHALAVPAIDADVSARLRGLRDFAPKPWAARFREIQAADGSIEITEARVAQGETVAIGSGTLQLNAAGRLEGELRLTVAGLEPFLRTIGIERSAPVDRLAGALDRFMPGLGAAARAQAGAGVIAGLNLIGEQTTLEGRKAVAVPLRLTNGAIYLGPLLLGHAPALF